MQNYIHETVLRDIVELLHDAKDFDSFDALMRRNRSIKSLSSTAAGLVLVYPVIVSNSINIDRAQMVSKAIERKAVSMLRMVFSAMQFNNAEDVRDYLSRFHSNLRLDNDLSPESILDTIDRYMVQESANAEGSEFISKESYSLAMLSKELKNNDGSLQEQESYNESSISDFSFVESKFTGNVEVLSEAPVVMAHPAIRDRNAEAQVLQKNLLDNDVRKANELVETQLLIQVYVTRQDGGRPVPINAIIGVKGKMHPVDSMDIIERIQSKNKDRNYFLKFVQATTREISFFRDFLFAIDKAKIDALSVSKRHRTSSDLWKVLERRAIKSKIKRLMGSRNNAMAITTLVISQEEVEYIKKEHNINVEDPSIIRPILEAYNLMSFVIVDESTETAKFIFDTGEDLYEHLSFNALEREASDNSNKKMLNLIAKAIN